MEPYQTEMGRVHIIKRGAKWAVRRSGAARASFVLDDKRTAIERGRQMKGVLEVIVHRTDGTIQALREVVHGR